MSTSKSIPGCFEIYRLNNLVYLKTLKCASTYYANVFEFNGWKKDTANNIDWDKDHVFSFMMHPVTRRSKGLAQFVYGTGKTDLLKQDAIFWGNVVYLDLHAMPYTTSYGDFAYKIDWILLDHQDYTAKSLLEKLLEKFGVTVIFPEVEKNQSDNTQLKVFESILDKASLEHRATRDLGISKDVELYNDVSSKFRPQAIGGWEFTSWLTSTLKNEVYP